jgi:glycosyltransferase involved in cell wall biosynthesis
VTAPLRVHVDVTDTVSTHWRAGIQRVVLQVLAQLQLDDRLEVVPVVWLESARSFRTLTEAERHSLVRTSSPPTAAPDPFATPSTAARLVRAVRPTLGRLRRAVVGALVAIRVEPLLRRARRAVRRVTRDRALVPLAVTPEPGSWLFDMDTVWNNLWVDREELYRSLQDRGVHVAVLVHDLLPQEHPEWFESSLVEVSDRTIRAQLCAAELLMVTSADGAQRVRSLAHRERWYVVDPVVVTLGADAAGAGGGAGGGAGIEALPDELEGVDYVLCVGTIEPRKNHATLLDAFEQRWAQGAGQHLVLVGRPGWHNDDMLRRLHDHPEVGRRLHWYRDASDEQLAAIYRHATVVAVPSLAEGYGLPLIEALQHGVPVVASDVGAMVEAGAGLTDHVAAQDASAWAEALGGLLDDPAWLAERRRGVAGYVPPTWAGTGRRIADLLCATSG